MGNLVLTSPQGECGSGLPTRSGGPGQDRQGGEADPGRGGLRSKAGVVFDVAVYKVLTLYLTLLLTLHYADNVTDNEEYNVSDNDNLSQIELITPAEKPKKRNAHDFGDARATSRKVGKERLDEVLRWTFKWGWTYETVLQKLLGVERRPGHEFVKKGALVKVEAPRGHLPVYCIAPGFLTQAMRLHEAERYYPLALNYPWPKTTIPFSALGEHQEIAQLIALEQWKNQGGSAAGCILDTDRELRSDNPGPYPDFVLTSSTEDETQIEWHEIELTSKYRERLIHQMYERNKALESNRFTKIVWWCSTAGVARNIKAVLSVKSLPATIRRADYKIVRDVGARGWSPAKLLECSEILLTRSDRDNPPDLITLPFQSEIFEENEVIADL